MCTEEGRLRTIGVALSFKVRNSRSWSKLESANFRNGVRLVYHEGNIGSLSGAGWLTNETSKLLRQTLDSAEMRPTTAMPDSGTWLPGIAFTLVGTAGFEPATP